MCPFICFRCFFLLGHFLSHAELPTYLSLLPCGKTPIAIGQIFWRTAHPFSTFLIICFCYFWFVFWLVAFCQRYYRLVFFDVCFLLAGFCLASYRGVGVGCETPHLRSISPNFPYVFCALLIFYASASTGLQGGLVSWYPLPPLLLRRYSSRKTNNRPLAQSPPEPSILS